MKTLINIDVPELSTAIEFYVKALELKHSRTIDQDVAELVGDSVIIYLLQKDAGSPTAKNSSSTRNYARHWTPVHMDFVVDDIDAAKQKVMAAGAVCESEGVEWMESKCVTFSDPFGHGFCLIEFNNGTYAETA